MLEIGLYRFLERRIDMMLRWLRSEFVDFKQSTEITIEQTCIFRVMLIRSEKLAKAWLDGGNGITFIDSNDVST